jgi:hypothetical protein
MGDSTSKEVINQKLSIGVIGSILVPKSIPKIEQDRDTIWGVMGNRTIGNNRHTHREVPVFQPFAGKLDISQEIVPPSLEPLNPQGLVCSSKFSLSLLQREVNVPLTGARGHPQFL